MAVNRQPIEGLGGANLVERRTKADLGGCRTWLDYKLPRETRVRRAGYDRGQYTDVDMSIILESIIGGHDDLHQLIVSGDESIRAAPWHAWHFLSANFTPPEISFRCTSWREYNIDLMSDDRYRKSSLEINRTRLLLRLLPAAMYLHTRQILAS